MNISVKKMSLVVFFFAIIALAMGVVFIQQGFSKEAWLMQEMKQEQIAMPGQEGVIVDTAALAEDAADVVKEHRRNIAPTYGELLGGERYNPTKVEQLSYSQAMNIENYLYLAVTAFGVFTVVKAAGAFMIVVGLALGATGFALRKSAA